MNTFSPKEDPKINVWLRRLSRSIQMMPALVFQPIQCSVLLPDELHEDERVSKKSSERKYDWDSFMTEKY
jgi:hypothetical protein